METQRKRVRTMLVYAGLLFLMVPLATASVLSRLQTVDDPELGELIRVAIENYHRVYTSSPGWEEELKIVRDVTDSYARIKLLDQQIEQTQARTEQTMGEVRQEIILAKAELESKRTMELADLRQIMRIMPAHAFGRRPVSQLKSWFVLDVLDDETVVVYKARQPFSERRTRYSLVGLMSGTKAETYALDGLCVKEQAPMRIDIRRTVAGLESSKQLEQDIINSIRKVGLQMQAEVHLDETVRQGRAASQFYVMTDQVGTERRMTNGFASLGDVIEPNDIAPDIEQQLQTPGRLPVTFDLGYDATSEATADRLAQTVTQTAERLGIANLVDIERSLLPPDQPTRYLGTWEGMTEEETVRIRIRPDLSVEVSEIVNGDIRSTRTGRCALEDNRFVIRAGGQTLSGRINASGDLVLSGGGKTTTFKKTED